VDVRLAQYGIDSGVARFIVGVSKSLAEMTKVHSNFDLVFVGQDLCPEWCSPVIDLAPHHIRYLQITGPKILRCFRKLRWLWSSWAAVQLSKLFEKGAPWIWVAPGNTDAPTICHFFRKSSDFKVAQVIHDVIPLLHPKSSSFLFWLQFKVMTAFSLRFADFVPTVSQQTATLLSQMISHHSGLSIGAKAKSKGAQIFVVGNGIDNCFGSKARLSLVNKMHARVQFLNQMGVSADFANCHWVCAIGRGELYKNWRVIESAVLKANQISSRGVMLLRVGFGHHDEQRLRGCAQVSFSRGRLFPSNQMITLTSVKDVELSEIYRMSDVCAHPSVAEGFGLPPLEAAFSGTQVVYRAGTAVDDIFKENSLPLGFVQRIETSDAADWVQALLSAFEFAENDKSELFPFLLRLEKASITRKLVEPEIQSQSFTWNAVAGRLLNGLNDAEEKLT
jgi:glycogen synthase